MSLHIENARSLKELPVVPNDAFMFAVAHKAEVQSLLQDLGIVSMQQRAPPWNTLIFFTWQRSATYMSCLLHAGVPQATRLRALHVRSQEGEWGADCVQICSTSAHGG
jgi:hypothetical protein